MSNQWYAALPLTILFLLLSAFFVLIEFSMLSARRHRLEEEAEDSMTARAGLRSLNEITVMLAGAQLGITICTFALGAITKPWVHESLMPLLGLTGLSHGVSDVIAFVLAMLIVTFLHLIIGEMSPKSWAIGHPELALKVIAMPARWWVNAFRPLLQWCNHAANKLVRRAGVEPVDRAAAKGYDTETLHNLVVYSVEAGTLDPDSAEGIEGVIALENENVGEAFAEHGSRIDMLPTDATVADVQRTARQRRYLRVFIEDPTSSIPNIVHIRDTVLADPQAPAADFAHNPLRAPASTPIRDVLDLMRAHNDQICVVLENGQTLGAITWDDIMNQLWPEIQQTLKTAS